MGALVEPLDAEDEAGLDNDASEWASSIADWLKQGHEARAKKKMAAHIRKVLGEKAPVSRSWSPEQRARHSTIMTARRRVLREGAIP